MFKKVTLALLTATTIFSGIAAINKTVSRQNTATEITTETKTHNGKLDYSAEQDYSYADAFVCDIVDWNTNGEVRARMIDEIYYKIQ